MNASKAEKLRTGLRFLLGILLLWAAVSKLARPVDFLASIYAYELPLPRPLLKVVAIFLPWTELICGLLLLANLASETALVCASVLFVIFLLATGQAWARGLPISCGCFDLTIFGLGKKLPGLVTFLESVGFAFFRNLLLGFISVFLLRRRLAELISETVPSPATASVPQKSLAKQKNRAVSNI